MTNRINNKKFDILELGDVDNIRIYKCHKLPPIQLVSYAMKVAKIIAPLFKDDNFLTNSEDTFNILSSLANVVDKIDSDVLLDLANQLINKRLCFAGYNDKEMKNLEDTSFFNEWFEDNTQDMIKFYIFIISTNCKDFFNIADLS